MLLKILSFKYEGPNDQARSLRIMAGKAAEAKKIAGRKKVYTPEVLKGTNFEGLIPRLEEKVRSFKLKLLIKNYQVILFNENGNIDVDLLAQYCQPLNPNTFRLYQGALEVKAFDPIGKSINDEALGNLAEWCQENAIPI